MATFTLTQTTPNTEKEYLYPNSDLAENLQDFTNYTEVDNASNRITVNSATSANGYLCTNEAVYLYKEFPKDIFDSFNHCFTSQNISATNHANTKAYIWALTDDEIGSANTWTTYIGLQRRKNYIALVTDHPVTGADSDNSGFIATNVTRYITIIRSGDSCSAYIYTDAARLNLEFTLTITCNATQKYNVVYPLASDNYTLNYCVSVQNRDLVFNCSGCSDGSSFGWDRTGNTTNYECIDEVYHTPNYSDYINTHTTNNYSLELSGIQNPINSGIIKYLKVNTVTKSTYAASDSEYYLGVSPTSECSIIYLSNNLYLTNGWSKKAYIWKENPATLADWTWGDVDATAIAIKAKAGSTPMIDKKFTLIPNADGDITDCETTNPYHPHYTEVNSSDGYSSYIYVNNGDTEIDIFHSANHEYETGTIKGVTVFGLFNGNQWSRFKLKTGGNVFESGKNLSYSGGWYIFSHTWDINPNTTVAWTWDEIDALQFGVELDATTGGPSDCRCTYCYAIVDYEEAADSTTYVAIAYTEIGYLPDASTCTLNRPQQISTNHARNIKMLNFWNGDREVYDLNRSGKSMVLTGTENGTSACDTILCVRNMARNGATVTVSTLSPTYFNGNYRIRQFGWNKISSKPKHYHWILSLEQAD